MLVAGTTTPAKGKYNTYGQDENVRIAAHLIHRKKKKTKDNKTIKVMEDKHITSIVERRVEGVLKDRSRVRHRMRIATRYGR